MTDDQTAGTPEAATGGRLSAPEPESGAEDVQTPERAADGRLMVSATLGMVATAGPTLAEHLVERCPDHGCVEPAWEDGCHCEIVPLLRRLAGEAQQDQPIVSTADKAEALGMTPTEYRAHSHRAAVEAVRAAAQGLYADAGLRVMAVLDEAQQDPTQDGTAQPRRGDWFEQWLVTQRDRHGWQGTNDRVIWDALDTVVGLYRLYADASVARSGQPETDEETDRA